MQKGDKANGIGQGKAEGNTEKRNNDKEKKSTTSVIFKLFILFLDI